MRLALTFLYLLIYPVLILLLSGDWFWPEGWIFSIWFVVLCVTTILYLRRRNPALLNERYRKIGSGDQKGWDRYVVVALAIGFFAWIAVMPLDAKRYGWTSPFPLWLKCAGGAALIKSFFFLFRAFADNTFLSPMVRVQKDRKQHVVSSGVYAFVRHPMYLGAALLFTGAPVLMSSIAGIGLGVALTLLLAGRILGEEKALTEELDGYADYKKKVRFRLIPFVW